MNKPHPDPVDQCLPLWLTVLRDLGAARVVMEMNCSEDGVQCSCIFEHMARTLSDELGRLAEDAVVAALDNLGIRHDAAVDSSVDVLAHIDDRTVAIEVKTTAYATPERVRTIVGRYHRVSGVRLLVADHITEAARAQLVAAGWSWLDRRGHLYLRAAGVMIDRDVEPLPRPNAAGPADPIAGAAGRAVAYAVSVPSRDAPACSSHRRSARLLACIDQYISLCPARRRVARA